MLNFLNKPCAESPHSLLERRKKQGIFGCIGCAYGGGCGVKMGGERHGWVWDGGGWGEGGEWIAGGVAVG